MVFIFRRFFQCWKFTHAENIVRAAFSSQSRLHVAHLKMRVTIFAQHLARPEKKPTSFKLQTNGYKRRKIGTFVCYSVCYA